MTVRTWRDQGAYLVLLGLVLVVLVQATLLARIRLFGVQPNLVLVLVVCWSLLNGVTEGLIFAFLAGLALDIIAGLPLGASSLALMPVCFLAIIGRRSVYVNNLWLPTLLVALATPLEGWLMLFIRQLNGAPVDWLSTTIHVILPALALNVFLTVIVVRVMRQFGGWSKTGAAT